MAAPLDPQYVDAIKGFEGYRDTPYWDYKQYTSGYGTKAAAPDEKIDQATADQRLTDALSGAAAHVDSVNPNLPTGVRAALTSLTYNAGPGWANAGLGDLIRSGDIEGARNRLLEYNRAGGQVNPGLVSRRAQEAAWFDHADHPVPPAPIPNAGPQQPLSLLSPAHMAMFASQPPIFPQQQPQAQQQDAAMPSYWDQMPPSLGTMLPPIFAPPKRPPMPLSRFATASGNRGFFFGRKV